MLEVWSYWSWLSSVCITFWFWRKLASCKSSSCSAWDLSVVSHQYDSRSQTQYLTPNLLEFSNSFASFLSNFSVVYKYKLFFKEIFSKIKYQTLLTLILKCLPEK